MSLPNHCKCNFEIVQPIFLYTQCRVERTIHNFAKKRHRRVIVLTCFYSDRSVKGQAGLEVVFVQVAIGVYSNIDGLDL